MKKNKGKYDKLLTVFLIIIFGALIATLGPYLYDEIKADLAVKEALDNFEETTNGEKINQNEEDNEELDAVKGTLDDILNELDSENNENASSNSNKTYNQTQNYDAVGKIEIPKTNISYPIYGELVRETLESGVAIAYGPGLNQTGNTVIYGHNFRNGKFFSNNKKLVSGDKIYITDLEGNRVEYRIYSVYITTPTDANYMIRDTAGRREISLQTCTDNNSGRIIVWATAD